MSASKNSKFSSESFESPQIVPRTLKKGKFGKQFDGLDLKFMDEDGTKITLRDDSDFELAIETARESAKGKAEGKLVLWCSDR